MVAPSSLLYWTSSSSSSTATTTTSMEKSCFINGGLGEQEMRRTTTSTRGSSRNKSGKVLAKKPPQRGLGVAQLERLRIQERWKKMMSTDHESDAGITTQFPHFHLHQFPFQEQQNLVSSSSSVPMIAAAGFSFQEQQICNLSSSLSSSVPQQQPPPVNFVFNPYYRSSGCGSSGVRSVYSDQFQSGNHYQQQNNPFESSSAAVSKLELSSNQKSSSHCLYDKCDVCLKKKRMNNGEILGFEGGAAQYLERKSSFDCSDHFLGLDLGRNWTTTTTTVNGGNQIRRSSYSSSGITSTINEDDQEEVEVMAIHRKGNKTGGGGGGGGSSSSSTTTTTSTVLMEYDFFPRKAASGGRSSSTTRSVIKKEPVSLFGGDHGANSSVVQLVGVGESSSSMLDLSLKLSC